MQNARHADIRDQIMLRIAATGRIRKCEPRFKLCDCKQFESKFTQMRDAPSKRRPA
jgi:hypothetical protein